jgi:hypothetical protein
MRPPTPTSKSCGRNAVAVISLIQGKPERAKELRAKGMTLPEIAPALGVDPRTNSRYIKKDSA